jgi:hypothetical protein
MAIIAGSPSPVSTSHYGSQLGICCLLTRSPVCRITNKWATLDRTLYPQLIRELLSRDRFEADHFCVTAQQTSIREIFQRRDIERQSGEDSMYTQECVHQHVKTQGLLSRYTEVVVETPQYTQGQSLEARIKNSNNSATTSMSSLVEQTSLEKTDMSGSSHIQEWPKNEPSHLTTGFKPSRASKNLERTWTQDSINRVVETGVQFNHNFKSDVSEFWLRNQKCSEYLNCAVRIENIAPHATMKEIFDMFREGKVFSFSISPPKPGRFATCATRLVFTTRAAAKAFISKAQEFPGISLHGHRWRVWWNRDRCCPVGPQEQQQSRVLRIAGPESITSAEGMENLFRKSGIKFDLVDLKEWLIGEEQMIAELSFSSILGQSRAAKKCFHEYLKFMEWEPYFKIWYATDPCEPNLV